MNPDVSSNEAIDVFRSYTNAFQALDPRAVAQHFNEPALLNAPHGVSLLPDRAAVERAFAQVMADLPGQGYARTEFSPFSERRLGNDMVVVTGNGTWLTKDNDVLMHFGLMYTLRRRDGHWRIVVATVYRDESRDGT